MGPHGAHSVACFPAAPAQVALLQEQPQHKQLLPKESPVRLDSTSPSLLPPLPWALKECYTSGTGVVLDTFDILSFCFTELKYP